MTMSATHAHTGVDVTVFTCVFTFSKLAACVVRRRMYIYPRVFPCALHPQRRVAAMLSSFVAGCTTRLHAARCVFPSYGPRSFGRFNHRFSYKCISVYLRTCVFFPFFITGGGGRRLPAIDTVPLFSGTETVPWNSRFVERSLLSIQIYATSVSCYVQFHRFACNVY